MEPPAVRWLGEAAGAEFAPPHPPPTLRFRVQLLREALEEQKIPALAFSRTHFSWPDPGLNSYSTVAQWIALHIDPFK